MGALFVYLRAVIERVSTHPARLVLELTPREWRRLQTRGPNFDVPLPSASAALGVEGL